MVHAIRIEAVPNFPANANAAAKAIRLAALAAQIATKIGEATARRGGLALRAQVQEAKTVPAKPRTGQAARAVALYRLTGSREDVVAAALAAVHGAGRHRVWYHACRHDEHKPCGPWELVGSAGA